VDVTKPENETARLEAFSDAVIAVAITIMVLQLPKPDGSQWQDLKPVFPTFLAYILSFTIIAIYWNNHHHLLRASRGITPRIMWANMLFLFWLSLVPFLTAWLGTNYRESAPTAAYALSLFITAVSYTILLKAIIANEGPESDLAARIGNDKKGLISLGFYVAAFIFAFFNHWVSDALFLGVALIWVVPDQRLVRQ
jgi:uncharacterized membrane protein